MRKKKLHYYIFIFGILLFLFYKAGFIIFSSANRSQPVEVDDSYVYLWKAVSMANCFKNNSPAQNDLREQLFVPTINQETEIVRIRTAGMLFLVYTPLHSMSINLFNKMGLDWVNAYRVVVIFGIFFICGTLAYWMFVTWGSLTAGVSLILMSPILFDNHGLHIIVPTNIALGIGFLMWGRISQGGCKSWIVLPLCGIAAVMMHPTGMIYTAVALGLYVIMVGKKISWKNATCISFTIGILLLAYFLPHIIERPMMDFNFKTTLYDTNWVEGIKDNINWVFDKPGSKDYVHNIKAIGIGLLAFLLSLILLEKKHHRRIITTGVLLCILCVSSFFFVLPNKPGDLFQRIWIPVLSFFVGAIAYILCSAVDRIPNYIEKIAVVLTNRDKTITKFSSFRPVLKKIISIAISFAIVGGLAWKLIRSTPKYLNALDSRIKRHPFILNKRQPAELLKHANSEDKVLYTDEIPLLFNLVNGTYKLGAIYYPAIRNTSIEPNWMKKLDYIVGWNKPFQELTREGQIHPHDLRLSNIDVIKYESEVFENLREFEIMISNPGESFEINLILHSTMLYGATGSTFQFHVPKEYDGWLSLSPIPSDILVNWLQLMPVNSNEKAKLTGFRFSSGNKLTLWPWRQQARITVNYKDNNTISTCFDVLDTLGSKELQSYFKNHPESLQVISDIGSTVTLHITELK